MSTLHPLVIANVFSYLQPMSETKILTGTALPGDGKKFVTVRSTGETGI
jgi:hypothetical protein